MIDFSSALESQKADSSSEDAAAWEFEVRDSSYGLTPSERASVAAEVLEEHLEQSPELLLSHPSYANTVTVIIEGLRERVKRMESIGYDRVSFSADEARIADLIVRTANGGTRSLKSSSAEDAVAYLQLTRDILSVPSADSRSVASMIAQVRYGESLLEMEAAGSKRLSAMLLDLAEKVKSEIRGMGR